MINIKNKILLLLISFCVFQSNGQDLLKEITKTFENGKPMFIDYLEMEDLKKVKTEIFNEYGTLIFSVEFNKDTGKYDGEFYDLINKGYFKDGVLNCNNCMLVEANIPSVFTYNHDRQNTLVTKGNVVNGRLTGKVERYILQEDTYSKVDWESTRNYVAAGAGSGFRDVKTYKTGKFTKTQLRSFNYNTNGVLDGEHIFEYKDVEMRRQKLNFENGIVMSSVTYDKNNLIIDSLFNENKIWKINKKFVKNDGFLIFSGLQEQTRDAYSNQYSVEYHKSGFYNNPDNPQQHLEPLKKLILLGGNQKIEGMGGGYYSPFNDTRRTMNIGGVPSALNQNGLYTIHKTLPINDIFNEELFTKIYDYLINSNFDSFKRWDNRYQTLGWFVQEDGFVKNGFDPIILTNEFLENGLKNPFNFFIKEKKLWDQKDFNFNDKLAKLGYMNGKRMLFFSSPSDFFTNFISLNGFLISCKELIENNIVEIQKIFIWDSVLKKYVLFDFDKLIDLSDESRIKKEESDYNINYKNRITSIFGIDIKELEQYEKLFPYELLNSNKFDKRKWIEKNNSSEYLPSIKDLLDYTWQTGKFSYGITSVIGLRNVDRFPSIYGSSENFSIDYVWILDFQNDESLIKFIENNKLLLKLNENFNPWQEQLAHNPDLHTPDLVYLDISKNRIGLKPTIGNWDAKEKRWYSVVNTDKKLSDNSASEIIIKPLENLELWYSSDKNSDFYLRQFSRSVKDLNSYYSVNLHKIEIHRLPGNEDATEAFTFYYFKDLDGLKKLEQLSSDNKSVSLYHKDENNLLLVYNAKK